MTSLSQSPLKTEKTNCIQNIYIYIYINTCFVYTKQAPGRRKGKENICKPEADSGMKLPVAAATPFVTKGKRQHWKKQVIPPSPRPEKQPAQVLSSSSKQAGNTCMWMKLYLGLDIKNSFTASLFSSSRQEEHRGSSVFFFQGCKTAHRPGYFRV